MAAYIACISGNLKALKKLRSDIKDIDYALENACEFGQLRIVKWLVGQGASVHRFTPLGKACKFGYLDVVKFLYKCGARNDLFAIQLAGEFGHLQVVKWVHKVGKVEIPKALAQRMRMLRQYDILHWIDRVQPERLSARRKRLLQLASFL